jgi:hypothetical protein
MTLTEQIAAAEAAAKATADRFVDAAHDPELRQALAAQLRQDTAVLKALRAAQNA